jgi:hypothetical protein
MRYTVIVVIMEKSQTSPGMRNYILNTVSGSIPLCPAEAGHLPQRGRKFTQVYLDFVHLASKPTSPPQREKIPY